MADPKSREASFAESCPAFTNTRSASPLYRHRERRSMSWRNLWNSSALNIQGG